MWLEGVEVVVGRLLGHSVDHERRMIWVVAGEVVALLEIGTVLHYHLTFRALVVTVESVVVHRSAVTQSFAVGLVLWR